jgi:hypothetical protein
MKQGEKSMMSKFEVRFAIDVVASSPEQAAAIARDMPLDPDTQLHANANAYEYHEPAEEWFPCGDHGVLVYFGDPRPDYIYGGDTKPCRGSGVRPVESVAWKRAALTPGG